MGLGLRGNELASAVYDQVTREPETHKQSVVSNGERAHDCGVKACIAGWTFLLAYEGEDYAVVLGATGDDGGTHELGDCFPDETSELAMHGEFTFSNTACKLLGLGRDSWPTFYDRVYSAMDERTAIINFKELTGL